MPKRYVTVFDTETTGFDPKDDYIYQLAAITLAVEQDHVRQVGEFEVKMHLPPEGLNRLRALREKKPEVVLYDTETWQREAVPTIVGLRSFTTYLNNYSWIRKISKKGNTYYVALMAGHNVDFDLKMIRAAYKRNDVFFPAEYWGLDTIALYRWLVAMHPDRKIPENFQLGTLAEHFDVKLKTAHDAMSDVRATVELIKHAWNS